MSALTAPRAQEAASAAPAELPPRPFALLRHSLLLAGRTLTKIRRTPEQLLDVTVQPIVFVILFVYVFGGAITGSQHGYLQFVLPAIMSQTVVFSSAATGTNLNTDIKQGVFDRFRSLPIPRSAPLTGAVLGDLVRYAVSMVVVIGFGYCIGFRIETDPFRATLACLLLMAFAFALCWAFVLVGVIVREPGVVQGIGFLVSFPLTFGSSMFVPPDTLPGWMRGWVQVNPVSHLVDAMRGLMIGGPALADAGIAMLWSVGLTAVLAPLAVAAYRRRT